MKKIFSILALAFIMSLSAPVFAATAETGTGNATIPLTVSVPTYLNMATNGTQKTAVTSTISSATSLSLNENLHVKYDIVSNVDATVTLTATAPSTADGGTTPALYGDDASDMAIVFSRNDSTATATAISNAGGSTADNLNAIAFKLVSAAPVKDLGADVTVTPGSNKIDYAIHPATTTLEFTISGSSLANTFTMQDKAGTYTATLYLAHEITP